MNSAEKEIKFKETNKMTGEHCNSGYLKGQKTSELNENPVVWEIER